MAAVVILNHEVDARRSLRRGASSAVAKCFNVTVALIILYAGAAFLAGTRQGPLVGRHYVASSSASRYGSRFDANGLTYRA